MQKVTKITILTIQKGEKVGQRFMLGESQKQNSEMSKDDLIRERLIWWVRDSYGG